MNVLTMSGITKTFPGVVALDQVDFELAEAEVHGLIGENGAGKSTLIKIITGVYRKDTGEMTLDGKPIEIQSPQHAQREGIKVIHQELSLCPYLTVSENIFMGRPPRRALPFVVDWKALHRQTQDILTTLRLDQVLNPRSPVSRLSVAQKQMVEIGKAISGEAKMILMDEPTSALTPREVETLFAIIRDLKAHGVSVVFISHKLGEVLEVCDRVTVLRDGHRIGTYPAAELTVQKMTTMMIGRSVTEFFAWDHRKEHNFGSVVLQVNGLSRGMKVQDISFEVRAGEILGIFGLMGAGRTELLRAVFGADRPDGGTVVVDGKTLAGASPRKALRSGLGLLPEERKKEGIFPEMSVKQNISISNLHNIAGVLGHIDKRAESRDADEYISALNIRTPSPHVRIKGLSGGNQQKTIVAKWLSCRPKVLLLDEPTRGIDVGAKAEIHSLIRDLAQQGLAVVMVSSELAEVMEMSDRVVVMKEGRVVGELVGSEASEEKVIDLLSGTVSRGSEKLATPGARQASTGQA